VAIISTTNITQKDR